MARTRQKHVPRIFVDQPLHIDDTPIALSDDKRHHLATVLRLGAGAELVLFNGDGYEYRASIGQADRKTLAVIVQSRAAPIRESSLDIALVQAVARGDRMDFALAKAVELGVTRIQPVFTELGQVRLNGDRLARKQDHWRRIVESAAQQSGRLICPPVEPAEHLADLLGAPLDETHLHLMLAPGASCSLGRMPHARCVKLLIGPESGLSPGEIAQATQHGWQAIALGPRVLRTETAGMAALAALQTIWGDLAGY